MKLKIWESLSIASLNPNFIDFLLKKCNEYVGYYVGLHCAGKLCEQIGLSIAQYVS